MWDGHFALSRFLHREKTSRRVAADHLLAICDQFQTGVNGNEGRLIAKKTCPSKNIYKIIIYSALDTGSQ